MYSNLFQGDIPFPPAFGDSSNLMELDLSQNKFTGKITASLGNLVALSYRNLGGNSL
jgi:Leucine-rich repeat (LRR) protein